MGISLVVKRKKAELKHYPHSLLWGFRLLGRSLSEFDRINDDPGGKGLVPDCTGNCQYFDSHTSYKEK